MASRGIAVIGALVFFGAQALASDLRGKRILYIDSYNQDYPWAVEILRAAKAAIAPTAAEMRIVHMNTKVNADEAYKVAKGAEVKGIIDSFRPDVVIASDDNASKYVIVPYVKGTSLPAVFCGVNWDASKYGFPAANVTGMVETNSYVPMLDILRAAGGDPAKVAVVTADDESERASLDEGAAASGVRFQHIRYVRDFQEWKAAFIQAQQRADLVLVNNNAGIRGWDDAEAAKFVIANSKVLTGSFNAWMAQFVAVTYTKVGAEQGQWAAEAAIRILQGTSPQEIPVARNRQDVLILNRRLADLATFKIPAVVFDAAARVIE